jgi:hypothetical protein
MPGTYLIPPEWRKEAWISDPSNFPDPTFSTFAEEWDYEFIDVRGVLCDFKRHIFGHESTSQRNGKAFQRKHRGRPETFYLFSIAALELINNPESYYRQEHTGQINGVFVVNYLNMIDMVGLLDSLDGRTKGKKHLVSPRFGALYARLFNRYCPGLRVDDHLKVEKREPRRGKCPNCKCIYEHLTNRFVRPTDKGYQQWHDSFKGQIDYRKSRDDNG